MRKILYLHNKADIGGGEISLINLWQNLDRAKFELYLLLPDEGQLSQLARDKGLAVNICPVPKISIFNITLRKCSFFLLFFYDAKQIGS